MLDNKQVVERIRILAKKMMITSDSEICRRCGFEGRGQLRNMLHIKTAPQLDTLDKFAQGLGCTIEDLIYDRSEADADLSRLIRQLSEWEKTKVAGIIQMMLAEKNKPEQKKAA